MKSIINAWQAVPSISGLQYLSHQPCSYHDKELTFIVKNNLYVQDLNMYLLGPEWAVKSSAPPMKPMACLLRCTFNQAGYFSIFYNATCKSPNIKSGLCGETTGYYQRRSFHGF
ncbi:MAG: hypothetical protein ABFS43_12755 [Thermodesulfobacteriota bacterium]